MGLPSYVINFEDLIEPMKKALSEADLNIDAGDIALDGAMITLDTTGIENQLTTLKTSLDNINGDTSTIETTANDILNALVAHNDGAQLQLTDIKSKIDTMLQTLTGIKDLLVGLGGDSVNTGKQKMNGATIHIEATPSNTYGANFTFSSDILITGFTISQSAWNLDDKWNLVVGSLPIMENIYTKMRGEHKQLSKFMPVPTGTTINFSFDNTVTPNSKYVWIDLEYIDLTPDILPQAQTLEQQEPDTPPPADGTIDVNDVINNWTTAVTLRWEGSCDTDLDLQVHIGSYDIDYGDTRITDGNGNSACLNFDYSDHSSSDAWNTKPEIITIDGFKGQTASIVIHNYNGGSITQDVSIIVQKKNEQGIITTYSSTTIAPSDLNGRVVSYSVGSITL